MMRWALLVGSKTAGPSLAARVAGDLSARGIVVGGVTQEPVDVDGTRKGYRARRVDGPESVVVAYRGGAPAAAHPEKLFAFCSLLFDEEAFGRARDWIARAAATADVVVVEEVSKLEVAGHGHHDAVRDAMSGRALVLLVVRGDQLFSVVERFALGEPVATLETPDPDAYASFVEEVARAARREIAR